MSDSINVLFTHMLGRWVSVVRNNPDVRAHNTFFYGIERQRLPDIRNLTTTFEFWDLKGVTPAGTPGPWSERVWIEEHHGHQGIHTALHTKPRSITNEEMGETIPCGLVTSLGTELLCFEWWTEERRREFLVGRSSYESTDIICSAYSPL